MKKIFYSEQHGHFGADLQRLTSDCNVFYSLAMNYSLHFQTGIIFFSFPVKHNILISLRLKVWISGSR
jgi:hypothetical protein